MPLSEANRRKLDVIVSQASANGETPETIQTIVDDFKSKYEAAGGKEPSKPGIGTKLLEGAIQGINPLAGGMSAISNLGRIVGGQPVSQVTQNPTNVAGDLAGEMTNEESQVIPAAIHGLAQTASLGQGNKLAAGIMTPFNGKGYDQNLQDLNTRRDELKASTPATYNMANLAGMFVGGPKMLANLTSKGMGYVLPKATTGMMGLMRGVGNAASQGAVAGAATDVSTNPDPSMDSVTQSAAQGAALGAIPPIAGSIIKGGSNFLAAVGLKSPMKVGQAFNREIGFAKNMEDVHQQATQKIEDVGAQRSAASSSVAEKPITGVKGLDADYVRDLAALEKDPEVVKRLTGIADKMAPKEVAGKLGDNMVYTPKGAPSGQEITFKDAEFLKTISNKNSFTSKTAAPKDNNAATYRRNVAERIDQKLKGAFDIAKEGEKYDQLNKRFSDLYMVQLGAEKALGSRESLSTTQIGADLLGNPAVASILQKLGNVFSSPSTARVGGYILNKK